MYYLYKLTLVSSRGVHSPKQNDAYSVPFPHSFFHSPSLLFFLSSLLPSPPLEVGAEISLEVWGALYAPSAAPGGAQPPNDI